MIDVVATVSRSPRVYVHESYLSVSKLLGLFLGSASQSFHYLSKVKVRKLGANRGNASSRDRPWNSNKIKRDSLGPRCNLSKRLSIGLFAPSNLWVWSRNIKNDKTKRFHLIRVCQANILSRDVIISISVLLKTESPTDKFMDGSRSKDEER